MENIKVGAIATATVIGVTLVTALIVPSGPKIAGFDVLGLAAATFVTGYVLKKLL